VVKVAAGEDQWPVQGVGAKSTTFAYPLNVNVYDPLIYLGSDFTLQPALATSWEFMAPSTWRFHLRQGVLFQDGHPFTADDVVWTWGVRQVKGQTLTTVSSGLTPGSVKKVDDFTVDFTTTTPNLRLPEQIVHPEGAIVENGKDFDSTPPVGTGPFKVVSYQPGQSVDLMRYDGYWGQKPKVKEMVYQFLPDPQTRVQALKAGTVDFVIDLPAASVADFANNSQYRVVRSKPGRNQLIYVNKQGVAPFDLGADQAVRKAVSLALDRKTYVDTVFESNADPGRWMAPQAILGTSASAVTPIPFDTAQAKSTLTADGWTPGSDGIFAKNGRRLELTIIGWAEVTDAAYQVIQSDLKDAGIALNIKKAADTPTYNNYYAGSQWDLDLEVPNQNDGNPAFLPVLRMYSKNKGTQRFAPGATFDAVAEQAQTAMTRPEVQAAAAEMMKQLIDDDYIVIPLAGEYRLFGMKSGVNLTDPHPSQTNQLWISVSKT
jgi:peptide/nickel transport system substrate-binding protein